jgi:hypothetical protein
MPDEGEEQLPDPGIIPLDASSETQPVSLPPVIPPTTKAPVQFNQQVNLSIQQIPATAWDRLAPDQIVEVSKMIIKQIEVTDQRHFDFARESVKRRATGMIVAVVCGSLIALSGYAGVVFLALKGHEMAAAIIGLPLTTVLAMVVGNRFLGRE